MNMAIINDKYWYFCSVIILIIHLLLIN